jgi:hypothetical protein
MVLPQTADRTAAALFHRSGLSASLIHFYGEGEGEAEGRVTMVTVVTSHNGHKKRMTCAHKPRWDRQAAAAIASS